MPITPDIPDTEAAIVEMTNDFRRSNKLAPVVLNAELTATARAYAKVLSGSKELSHLLAGTTPAIRATKAGYAYCQIGENLASASDSRGFSAGGYAKLAVEGWEHSAGHRRNLLLPYVTETGVAVMHAGPNDPRYIAVQLFARPRGMKFEFKIKNTGASAVPYTLGSDQRAIEGHGTLTLTACMPREIVFSTDVRTGAKGHYETRAGQVFTLKPADGGGVIVEVSEAGGRN
jgi:cysteine-rich secretory family protein